MWTVEEIAANIGRGHFVGPDQLNEAFQASEELDTDQLTELGDILNKEYGFNFGHREF